MLYKSTVTYLLTNELTVGVIMGLGSELSALRLVVGNESVPKIIINNTVNLFYKTAISAFIISNHNSYRVLFYKIASVYFI